MNTLKYKVLATVIAINLFIMVGSPYAGDPKITGDVVGRDLSVPTLGAFGHVGIWTGSKVLEVLNKKTVIQQNSLSSFKKADDYWGAKYGLGERHYRLINTGWDQRNFAPEYTLSATYTEGKYTYQNKWDSKKRKWVKVKVLTKAKFRCDTFVNYSYLVGIGIELKKWYNIHTPKATYDSFPKSR